MHSGKKIWALLDDRQGNNAQTLGVVQALGEPFESKVLSFNRLARLPHFLMHQTRHTLHPSSLALIAPPWPDMVIAAGRRTAVVAAYIKAKNPRCFIVQVQSPGWPTHPFDLIASPSHDEIPPGKNIIATIGAPNRVNDVMLKAAADKWRNTFNDLPEPKIALLVGGTSHNKPISAVHIGQLARLSSQFAKALNGSLLITSSRRTSKDNLDILTRNLDCPYYLHQWRDTDGSDANPYYGFLALATAIIVTGDSITMCSEACTSHKPVYIYSSPDFVPGRHRKFHQALYEHHLAQPLHAPDGEGLFVPASRLNDALTIASAIKGFNA